MYVLSDGAAARSLAGAGKALRKEWAFARTLSQDIRFRLFLAAFPPERMQVHKNVCTKAFVALVLFVYMNRRSVFIILYCVKNGVFCLQAGAVKIYAQIYLQAPAE